MKQFKLQVTKISQHQRTQIKVIMLTKLITFCCLSIHVIARTDCDPSSGWQCDYDPEFSRRNGEETFCDFPIISLEDNMDEFFRTCYFKSPCLINTTVDQWTNATFWHKSNLLKELGDYTFDSGESLELVLNAGVGKLKKTLSQYIEMNDKNENNYLLQEPIYIFDRTIWETQNRKFRDNNINKNNVPFFDFAERAIKYDGAILAMGNTGTGATMHAHGENWLFLIAGRKRWFVYPPNLAPPGGFWPAYSSKDWFQFIYPHLHRKYDKFNDNNLSYELNHLSVNDKYNKPRSSIYARNLDNGQTIALQSRDDILLTDYKQMNDDQFYGNSFFKPLECMQSKGQIIYLPEFYWHSVLNLGNIVIGAAVQTSHSRTPWLMERNVHDEVRNGVNNPTSTNWTDLEEDAQRMRSVYVYTRLTQYGPMSAVHHFFIGFEYWDMGAYEPAVKHLTDAILMDPTYLQAYTYLSRVYSDNHPDNEYYDMGKAEAILRIAYIMNPNNNDVQRSLLEVLHATNQRELWELVQSKQQLPPK